MEEVIVRLQKGYFSSASIEARNMATSWNELPRWLMRANSLMPMPLSPTMTFSGVKSFKTAEAFKLFLLRRSAVCAPVIMRSEEHTSELQSHLNLVCRLLLEKKKKI